MEYIEFVEGLVEYGTAWDKYARYLTKNFDWAEIKNHIVHLDDHHKRLVLEALKQHGCDLVSKYPELKDKGIDHEHLTDLELFLSEYKDADKNVRETMCADADQELRFWNEALNAIKEIEDNEKCYEEEKS